VSTIDALEARIRQAVDQITGLRKENHRLRAECESLKGHVALLSGENGRAQQVLAEVELLRRRQEQVTHRVERALHTLNGLKAV
jgi:FtsZ-binding cell division protein ZapB